MQAKQTTTASREGSAIRVERTGIPNPNLARQGLFPTGPFAAYAAAGYPSASPNILLPNYGLPGYGFPTAGGFVGIPATNPFGATTPGPAGNPYPTSSPIPISTVPLGSLPFAYPGQATNPVLGVPGVGPLANLAPNVGSPLGNPSAVWASGAAASNLVQGYANPWQQGAANAPMSYGIHGLTATLPAIGGAMSSAQGYPYTLPSGQLAFARIPSLDIFDEGESFVCQVDLPGVKPENVDVHCAEQTLTIVATREADADVAGLVQSERGVLTTYSRNLALPATIRPEQAKAVLRDGVLTVSLTKQEPTSGGKRIEIQH